MLAAVQCARARGDRDQVSAASRLAERWFLALEEAYARDPWREHSFADNSVVWEALVLVAAAIEPGPAAGRIRGFTEELGSFLHARFLRDEDAWSPHGAHALAQSWLREADDARKQELGRAIDAYIERWEALIYPKLDVNASYTCDLVRGLAPLLAKQDRSDAVRLVRLLLHLMEKDIDFNQIRFLDTLIGTGAPPSKAMQTRMASKVAKAQRWYVEGAFLRDEEYYLEAGRRTIRIDDNAHCALALSRSLTLVKGIASVAGAAGSLQDPTDAGKKSPNKKNPSKASKTGTARKRRTNSGAHVEL